MHLKLTNLNNFKYKLLIKKGLFWKKIRSKLIEGLEGVIKLKVREVFFSTKELVVTLPRTLLVLLIKEVVTLQLLKNQAHLLWGGYPIQKR